MAKKTKKEVANSATAKNGPIFHAIAHKFAALERTYNMEETARVNPSFYAPEGAFQDALDELEKEVFRLNSPDEAGEQAGKK